MNLIKSIVERFIRIIIVPKEKLTYVVSRIFGKNYTAEPLTRKGTVLIGALKNPGQLSVCIRNKFYHIPLHLAGEKAKEIEYVAIYQSKNFFGRMAGILYYGKVKRVSCIPRFRITEIPKVSMEKYFRFDVEKWMKLDKKIEPKDLGVICEFTTIEKLKAANDVSDLVSETKMGM